MAWAVTVHKLQGCTVDSAVIDIGPKNFAAGQIYVALSRVRNSADFILCDFRMDLLSRETNGKLANEAALKELKKLRELPYDKGQGQGRRRFTE